MKTICPKCKKEAAAPQKTWKYGFYQVESYECNNCGTSYREYIKNGASVFTLKREQGKKSGLVKVNRS